MKRNRHRGETAGDAFGIASARVSCGGTLAVLSGLAPVWAQSNELVTAEQLTVQAGQLSEAGQ